LTNNDVSHDEQLRAALGRYEGRFEPARPDWEAVAARHKARHAAGQPAPRRHQRRVWMFNLRLVAVAVPAVAVVVIVANFASVSIHLGQSPAQAKSTPAAPPYRPVTPRPTFPAGSTMAAVQTRGFIRIGVKDDQPGFGFKDPTTGAWSGFDIETAKLMAAGIFGGDVNKVENKILFVPIVSAAREADLKSGAVDLVIATYTINAAREQIVDFAGPYFRAQQDIMVKTADTAITTVADLNGRKVCTVKGSTSYTNLLAAAPHAQVTLLATYSGCAQQLAAGKVDAVTTDNVILAGLVHENGFIFKLVNSPFSDEPYGIGLKKGDEALRAYLNERLAMIEADGDWTLAETYALQGIQGFTPPPIAS
jgi:glutamate transport system substrate-binding protein